MCHLSALKRTAALLVNMYFVMRWNCGFVFKRVKVYNYEFMGAQYLNDIFCV